MVANWVYWRHVSGASKRAFATIKLTYPIWPLNCHAFINKFDYLRWNLFHSAKHSEKTLKREELTDIERLLITNDPGVLQTCLNAIEYERTSQNESKNNCETPGQWYSPSYHSVCVFIIYLQLCIILDIL